MALHFPSENTVSQELEQGARRSQGEEARSRLALGKHLAPGEILLKGAKSAVIQVCTLWWTPSVFNGYAARMDMPVFDHPPPGLDFSFTLLFETPPDSAAVERALEKLDAKVVEEVVEGQLYRFKLRDVSCQYVLVEAKYPETAALERRHPVLCPQAAPQEKHRQHALLLVEGGPDATTLEVAMACALLGSQLSEYPGTVGVLDPYNACTWHPEQFRELVREAAEEESYGPLFTPVWFSGSRDAFVCTTLSLAHFGHAELQMVRPSCELQDAFERLMDLSSYVLSGASLYPGQTVGYSESEKIALKLEPWVSDESQEAISISL